MSLNNNVYYESPFDNIENIKIDKNIPVNEIIKEGYRVLTYHFIVQKLVQTTYISQNNPIVNQLYDRLKIIRMKLQIAKILNNKNKSAR